MKILIPYLLILVLPWSNASAQGYVAAFGGGSVPDHVYEWIVEKSGGGKIIVLTYADGGSGLPDLFVDLGASESYQLTIDSRAKADMQSTYDEIISADAVYLRGGNQWIYVREWKDTKTEDAIRQVYNNGGVVSGTSAGAMVLSEFVFTAQHGTVYSPNALRNPTGGQLAIDDGFINVVEGTLIDTHFIERGRFGRLLPFLFKIYVQRGQNILGIGIDDQTALCIGPDGISTVKGTGAVAFYNITDESFIASSPQGYTIENIVVDQLVEDWQYDVTLRQVVSMPPTAREIATDRAWDMPGTTVWLSGQDEVVFNTDHLMPLVIDQHNPERVAIIYSQNYENTLTPLTDYLDAEQIAYSLIHTTSDDPAAIADADILLFAGNNLEDFSNTISDTPVGEAVQHARDGEIPFVFFGRTGKLSSSYFVDNIDEDEWAAYRGKMEIREGLSLFGDMHFQNGVFDDYDFYENRSASVMWGLMKNRSRIGMYLQTEDIIKINHKEGILQRFSDTPYILVDAQYTEWVDSSRYRVPGGVSPRQVVAMTDLRYHVSSIEEKYSIVAGAFGIVSSTDDLITDIPQEIHLKQNYPNPFNDQTVITFSLPRQQEVSLCIYDILGTKITTLVDTRLSAGRHAISFSAANLRRTLASGTYFYRLQTETGSITKKMLYVR